MPLEVISFKGGDKRTADQTHRPFANGYKAIFLDPCSLKMYQLGPWVRFADVYMS